MIVSIIQASPRYRKVSETHHPPQFQKYLIRSTHGASTLFSPIYNFSFDFPQVCFLLIMQRDGRCTLDFVYSLIDDSPHYQV